MTQLIIDIGVLARVTFEAMHQPGAMPARVVEIIASLGEQYQTDDITAAWDSRRSIRKEWFGGYKAKRHARPWPEREQYYAELEELRATLPMCSVSADGYEGDDCIATLCRQSEEPADGNIIICSSDHDMWELLTDSRVSMLRPGAELPFRGEELEALEGIRPEEAHAVHCLAGCSGDEVPGLPGVGQTWATRMVRACPQIIDLLRDGKDDDVIGAVKKMYPRAEKYARLAIQHKEIIWKTEQLVTLYTVTLEHWGPHRAVRRLHRVARRLHRVARRLHRVVRRLHRVVRRLHRVVRRS